MEQYLEGYFEATVYAECIEKASRTPANSPVIHHQGKREVTREEN